MSSAHRSRTAVHPLHAMQRHDAGLPARRARRRGGRRHALAWAACLALASPAALALDVFTGNAPIFVGSWFNGSFTEVHEFQFALDWAGWCNAHAGSNCKRLTFWNVAGNWDGNAIPNTSSGDARVEIGRTVRVGSFNSIYRGSIFGGSQVSVLSAAGRVEIAGFGALTVGNATFADLRMDVFAQLFTSGYTRVADLALGTGEFGGVGGITEITGWRQSAAGTLNLSVLQGHTLIWSAGAPYPSPPPPLLASLTAPASLNVRLQPGARLENRGQLEFGGGQVLMQGTANINTLPVFDNLGALTGGGTLGAVRFNNAGSVNVGQAGSLAFVVGTHSGSFSGGVNSSLTFGGIFGGAGHLFLAGSAVNSLGDVIASSGTHRVSGSWNAARTFVQGGGQIDFDGPAPQIGELHLTSSGTAARFNSTGGASLQSVFIDSSFGRVEFNAGSSTAQRLVLLGGVLDVEAALRVEQSFDWHSGFLVGMGTTRLPGQTTLHAGTRAISQAGRIDVDGTIDWQGGNFSQWSGRMDLLPSGRLNIAGDFSSAGGGGSIVNWGVISKQAGAGRADLGMAVHSDGGLFRALAGTLALTGGGVHNDATFEAAPGARIEISGGKVFGRSITATGRLDVVGGSFELLSGVQYAHAAGNRFDVSDVRIGSGASLQLADPLVASGSVHNLGTFAPAGSVNIAGDFNQQGSFALVPGASLSVGGQFTNNQSLTLTNSPLWAGSKVNWSTLSLAGNQVVALMGDLHNFGTLSLEAGTGFSQLTFGGGSNSGSILVNRANTLINAGWMGTLFVNSGLIVNEGDWRWNGSSLHTAGARMDSYGPLSVFDSLQLAQGSQLNKQGHMTVGGSVFVDAGASLNHSGTYLQYGDAKTVVSAGGRFEGSGSFTQLDGLTVINGLLRADGGIYIEAGTLRGSGTAQGQVRVGPAAQWELGNSPGTFTVLGDAILEGRMEVEVQSLTVHDRLVVSGNFITYPGSSIDLIFDAGFQPADGDRISWLQTTGLSLQGNVVFSGLPSDWSAALDPFSHSVLVTYDLANAIPLSGSHQIAAGDMGYNALSGWPYPSLSSLQNDGTFSNRSGAYAIVVTLNNASAATVINRGELSVNTLNSAGNFQNRPGSTLQVSTLNNSGHLANWGTVQTYGDFSNAAGAVFEQRGEMLVNGRVTNDGRLVVAGRLSGSYGYNGSGDVDIETGGSFEGSAGGWFWASAGHVRVDGLLAAGDIRFFGNNNGRLSGTGRLQGNVQSDADIEPGNSIGTLTVDGDLTAGNINLEIASATDFDRLVVTGNATINSATLYLLGSYRPTLGDSLSFFSVGGALQLSSTNWAILRQVDAQDASMGWTLWADAQFIHDPGVPALWRAQFVNGTLNVVAVPEPGTWALFAGGLGALGWLARRRKAQR
ncbi:MAG: PEP-CTERM sorting domain-containing protein [Rubrivivax sp.]|nr:PEP-CTERM sorting domain-containing protein [Rubrivivax sp.]